ncbi:MAG: glycine--tRNA ligase subunit beta [Parvularculaceae bacterium]
MPDLLIELFSEEIPARMQARAAGEFERMMNERLLGLGLMPDHVKAFSGPRRLTLIAGGLPLRQPDRKEEKKGPRVGAPEKAIEGFLKSAGLSSIDECDVESDKKGEYYVARIEAKGRDTAAIIAEAAPEIIANFPWPKSMRWGDGDLKWVRPLKSILCCFDNEIVPFEIDGVRTGDETRGHRGVSSSPIHARNFDKYAQALTSEKVMIDAEARRELIAGDAKTLCQAQGLELVEDKGLLAEVSGLAEWPVVMMGAFEEKFLALPDEVLTASMRGHQKYFSVRNPKTGRLANRFVFVANIEPTDGGKAMRAGYERVLTARLSDAWYLYHQDLKTPLEERVNDLDRVTFFEGLGSIGDKARRIAALAKEIAPSVGADPELAAEAARLAKADLTTGMVYEFPELQGLMGRYYALAQKLPAEIADAIRDHYKPMGADDDVPTASVSVAVALADKLITLFGFWRIRERPTGSSDPFALRRAALGVCRILLGSGARLPFFSELMMFHASNWGSTIREIPEGETHLPPSEKMAANDRRDMEDLLSFFHDRLKVYLKDKGHRYDRIDAVLTKADGSLEDDLVLIVRKLEALEAFLTTDDGANLAAGYKRAANILKAEEKKGALPVREGAQDKNSPDLSVSEKALEQAEEKALFAALQTAEEKAEKAVAAEKFEDAMSALAGLRSAVDAFFDKVTVNADDKGLRANRLALLQRFIAATARVADLSKLEG